MFPPMESPWNKTNDTKRMIRKRMLPTPGSTAHSILSTIVLAVIACIWLRYHFDGAATFYPGVSVLTEAQTLAVTAAALTRRTLAARRTRSRS